MTLIASIAYPNSTILMGDLLVTTDSKKEIDINIPSGRRDKNINQVLGQRGKRQILSTVQKLNLLSDRLCIGIAGDAHQALELIETLSTIANEKELNESLLNKTLACFEESRTIRIQFVGVLVELDPTNSEKYRVVPFKSHSLKRNQYKGNISAVSAGSGSKSFDTAMKHFSWRRFFKSYKEYSPQMLLNTSGLSISSLFTSMEFLYGSNLADAWGGGIEIVTTTGGKLHKLDDIIHVFVDVEEVGKSGKHKFQIRNKFVKYQYFEDLLCIRTVELLLHKDKPPSCLDTIHLVTPANKKQEEYNLMNIPFPTLKGKYLLCHLYVKGKTSYSMVKFSNTYLEEFSIEPDFSDKCIGEISDELLTTPRQVQFCKSLMKEIGEFLQNQGVKIENREDVIARLKPKT